MNHDDEARADELAQASQARLQQMIHRLDRTDEPKRRAAGHLTRGYWDQSVLVIDDAPEIHDLIAVRLRPEGVELHRALDAKSGLAMAKEVQPDLILLDLDLPDHSGIEVCRQLKADPALEMVPIIFLTGTGDVAIKEQAFDAGATDYVTKPFDAVELRARVRATLRMKRIQDFLATRAQLDGLTGLWNRTYFELRLEEAATATRRFGHGLAVILLDIDQFRQINREHGVPAGDRILRQVAEALIGALTPCDTACRISGEEFGVILPETKQKDAEAVAERLRERIADLPLIVGNQPVSFTASLGVASVEWVGQRENWTIADLIEWAQRALKRAKTAGGDQVCGTV